MQTKPYLLTLVLLAMAVPVSAGPTDCLLPGGTSAHVDADCAVPALVPAPSDAWAGIEFSYGSTGCTATTSWGVRGDYGTWSWDWEAVYLTRSGGGNTAQAGPFQHEGGREYSMLPGTTLTISVSIAGASDNTGAPGDSASATFNCVTVLRD